MHMVHKISAQFAEESRKQIFCGELYSESNQVLLAEISVTDQVVLERVFVDELVE
jgi:hypothetical protein